MEFLVRNSIWLILVLAFLGGCSRPLTGDSSSMSPGVEGRSLVIWMLSDIQPSTLAERQVFEQAISDVNAGVPRIDLGLIAGDLLKSRSKDEAFSWFLATRNRSKVRHWYELAGNHDVRSAPIFSLFFPRPAYYGVAVGNLLILLLSDTHPSSATDISDEAFAWWRDMVLGNQDRIILTLTHGHLQGSGLLGSSLTSRQINGSERFEKVLQEARVAIWASGHTHLPQGLPGTVNVQETLGSTCFVNVSSIDTGPFMSSQSRFFFFQEGSSQVLIRSRNHSLGRFEEGLDRSVSLGKPFVFPGKEPELFGLP